MSDRWHSKDLTNRFMSTASRSNQKRFEFLIRAARPHENEREVIGRAAVIASPYQLIGCKCQLGTSENARDLVVRADAGNAIRRHQKYIVAREAAFTSIDL